MKKWTNPGPVARWCPACKLPRVCGRQVTTAARASDMDSTNTWAACPKCGTRLEAITNSNNGGMTAGKETE